MLLDSATQQELNNSINSVLSKFGVEPTQAITFKKKSEEKLRWGGSWGLVNTTEPVLRHISKEKVPQELLKYYNVLQTVLEFTDSFFLYDEALDTGSGTLVFHGGVTCVARHDDMKDEHAPTLKSLVDWLRCSNGRAYQDRKGVKDYRWVRILSDAAACGCFPKDVELKKGVGFVLTPLWNVKLEEYHKRRQEYLKKYLKK